MSSQSRHVYTREERLILEASFARQSHPDINEKERLAKALNCNIIQISNWFQNHRRRIKKLKKPSTASNPSPTLNTVTDNSPVFQTSFVYHQPQCPYNVNHDNQAYYYYPATSQYVYTHEPMYPQATMYFEPFVNYEQ